MTTAGVVAALLGALVLVFGRIRQQLHLYQLEHYEPARLREWVRRRHERVLPLPLVVLATCAAVLALATTGPDILVAVAGVAALATLGGLTVSVLRRPQAKPLVYTARVRRLLTAAALVAAVVVAALMAGVTPLPLPAAVAFAALAAAALHVAGPELVILADRIIAPIQRADNRRFEQRARRRLLDAGPLVVGITGSYGKTTTKAAAAAVAGLAGPAYATPASFNSYLGVVRAINEGLTSRHRTFLAEMGAYRVGDIAELCELVHPTIGIVTTVGPAHLERFGSLDVTERAKGELAEALPPSGLLITRADQERTRRIAQRTSARVMLISPEPHPDADVWAEDLELVEGRSQFTLRNGDEAAVVRARLLGRHNVANLVAGAALGIELGAPLAAIARALAAVEPPPHRLAPIVNSAAGIVVIDDAYNANPEGAAAALEVLRDHAAARRLLVTPGMVELGSAQDEANRAFGKSAAEVCDLVILVGPEQTRPIRAGLDDAGFPAGQIHTVRDSRAAAEMLATTTRRGDVVLFENDLPDLYL